MPTIFIDLNGSRIFESKDPYIQGSITGEGLIDIYRGTHKTITREDYELFTSTGKGISKRK